MEWIAEFFGTMLAGKEIRDVLLLALDKLVDRLLDRGEDISEISPEELAARLRSMPEQWRRIDHAATRAARRVEEARGEPLSPYEATEIPAAAERAVREATQSPQLRAELTEGLSEYGDLSERAIPAVAEVMANVVLQPGQEFNGLLYEKLSGIERGVDGLRGYVRQPDIDATFRSLVDVAFRLEDVAHHRESVGLRDEECSFIEPPARLGQEETEALAVRDLARFVLDAPARKVAVRGPAGIGKSRLMRELTAHLLRQRSARRQVPLPLYIAPHKYQDWRGIGDLARYLKDISGMRAYGTGDKTRDIRRMLEERGEEVLVILDALDQARNRGIEPLLREPDALGPFRVVVTGREEGFGDLQRYFKRIGAPIVQMQRFTPDHVDKFVAQSVLADRPRYAQAARADSEKDQSRRTYDTPLMLSLLAAVARDAPAGQTTPVSELELFEAYIDEIHARGREQCREEHERLYPGIFHGDVPQRIWERLAYEAFSYWQSAREGERFSPQSQSLDPAFIRGRALSDALGEVTEAGTPEEIEFALRCGVLWFGSRRLLDAHSGYVRRGTLPPGPVSFVHLAIQEYLAARALVDMLEEILPKDQRSGLDLDSEYLKKEMTFERLRPLARPRISRNTARFMARMLEEREPGGGWVDAFLEWILHEDEVLVYDAGEEPKGRTNRLRSNILYTAMAVRNERYGASLERFQDAKAPPTCPHGGLETLWEKEWEKARARQEEHAERIAHLEANWPEVLAPFDAWAVLPPGTSIIGGLKYDDEQPIRKLRFPLGDDDGVLLMCRHPVTNAEYRRFVEETGYTGSDSESHVRHWREEDKAQFRGADKPVVYVSWNDAREYCRWLDAQVDCTVGLPRELLWEHACRAGSTTEWCCGNDVRKLRDCAWYRENSEGHTRAVGGREPNAWGLHDMHGNVREWCRDWFDADSCELRPTESPAEGASRVLRGGSWSLAPEYCRSAYRIYFLPSNRYYYVGFRVLLSWRE